MVLGPLAALPGVAAADAPSGVSPAPIPTVAGYAGPEAEPPDEVPAECAPEPPAGIGSLSAAIRAAFPFLRPAEDPDGNAFYEREAIRKLPTTAEWQSCGRSLLDRLRAPGARFFAGRVGRIHAARFVARDRRTDGDFRYAYGEEAFRAWMRADARLAEIPVGALADALDLGLLAELNRIAYVPETQGSYDAGFFFGRVVVRGGTPEPGVVRAHASAHKSLVGPFTDEQKRALRSHGVTLSQITGPRPEARRGFLFYVRPDRVQPELNRLIAETRAALREPGIDPIRLAARFEQKFIALHPFHEANGRIGRLVRDRILMEHGLLPPIMKDHEELTRTEDQQVAEISAGMVRTVRQLQDDPRYALDPLYECKSKDPYATPAAGSMFRLGAPAYLENLIAGRSGTNIDLSPPGGEVVRFDGMPFAMAQDGFVYDVAGRAYLANPAGELEPLSHVGHLLLMRRLATVGDPASALDTLTRHTRAVFAALSADPSRARVRSDREAIAADQRYRPRFPSYLHAELIALADPDRSDDEALFAPTEHFAENRSRASFAISRYQQHDLELWHLSHALREAGDEEGAKRVRLHRNRLFERARAYVLTKTADPGAAAPGNPNGFRTAHEQIAFEHSPLASPSLGDHVARHGDDSIRLWRGELAIAAWTGIHPQSIPFHPDARALARRRARSNGSGNYVLDLRIHTGSSDKSAFQSFTSDLGLLQVPNGFSVGGRAGEIVLEKLPAPVRSVLGRRFAGGGSYEVDSLDDVATLAAGILPATPAGHVDLQGLDRDTALRLFDGWAASNAYDIADAVPKIRARIESAFESTPSGPGRWLLSRIGESPRLVRIDDLLTTAAPAMPPDSVAANKSWKETSLSRIFEQERALVSIAPGGREGTLSVTAYRRALLVEIDKEDALPGLDTLGGSFEYEQEVDVLETIPPTRVRASFTHDQLGRPLRQP